MQYRAWTKEEDEARGVIEKGTYPFIVVAIEKKMTKKGTYEMLEVTLMIVDYSGQKRRIKDWIVLMDEMGWKLRHLAITCGLLQSYEDGSLEASDFLNKDGAVEIGITEMKDVDGNKTGKKTNQIIDYVLPAEVTADNFKDSDIKF